MPIPEQPAQQTPATNNTTPGQQTQAPANPPTDTKPAATPPASEPTKPEAAKSLLGSEPEKEVPAKSETPEKYELKMPEGVSPDTKLIEGFEPLAKELGLSNEKAQKLVDLYAKHVDSLQKAQVESLDNQRKEWVEEIQKDPKYKENLSLAKKGLSVATPEAQKLINETWLGDHPALIATFAKIGKLLSEHTMHDAGETTTPPTKSPADILYPGLSQK